MDKIARKAEIRIELDMLHTRRMQLLKELDAAGPFGISGISGELERLGMQSDDLVHELTRMAQL